MALIEPIRRLTVATLNQGKLDELIALLNGLPIELASLRSLGNAVEVDETGSTFAENAVLKASGYARITSTFTLADDSGLEVAALGGRPGVLSARYGGADSGFDRKMAMILAELAGSGSEDRRARFVCSMAIADPAGNIVHTAEGVCTGIIAAEPLGKGGFGYDPIFIPEGHDRTFGQLSPADKHQISHRARALAEIIPFLRDNSAL
ncbi:MAG: RdgB/HAM1 family non-canonical purine NTP pyrophosphatase [Pyrinomonadaceae bacterium]|nr:RdgB/HAM1 family non-canonical purine NTP pyrophosphatase [Pyrinomonadaceae bacterium]